MLISYRKLMQESVTAPGEEVQHLMQASPLNSSARVLTCFPWTAGHQYLLTHARAGQDVDWPRQETALPVSSPRTCIVATWQLIIHQRC